MNKEFKMGKYINSELCNILLRPDYATDNWKEENKLRAIFIGNRGCIGAIRETLKKDTS